MSRQLIDLIGQRFGKLVVNSRVSKKGEPVRWLCQCDCGKQTEVYSANLRNGFTQSCGCLKRGGTRPSRDLSQQRFGHLVALTKVNSHGPAVWKCVCDCGKETYVMAQHLLSHNTQSCGCAKKSYGEETIAKILSNNNIDFIQEYRYPELGLMRYDFYLPQYNRLIEFDGAQHYYAIDCFGGEKRLEETQARDKIKTQYALDNHIDLVRIPYWERDKITLDMILGDQYKIEN